MAYKKKEEQKVLVDIRKNERGDYIRTSSIRADGEVSYDIRSMYTNADGEIAYTQKGVRIKKEMLKDIIPVIMHDLDPETFNEIIARINEEDE